MSPFNLDKKYISDITKFFNEFEQQHPKKSESQQREIDKYARIAKLRDDAETL